MLFCIITSLSDRKHLLKLDPHSLRLEALGIMYVVKSVCQIATDVNELDRIICISEF